MNFVKKHAIRDLQAPQAPQDIDDNFDAIFKALRILSGQLEDVSDTDGVIGSDGLMGPPGQDGSDGEDGLIGAPGARGVDGATGATGPAGPATLGPMGMEPDSPEEPMMVPGPVGPTGAAGITGAAGAQAIGFVLEGEPGEDGMMGPPGAAGSGSGGGSDWDFTLETSSDFDVTNSTIQVGVTGLSFSVVSGETWLIEEILVYAGNGTGVDMRTNITFPTATGIYNRMYITVADAAGFDAVRVSAATSISTISAGTRATIAESECLRIQLLLTFAASGTFQPTQANQNAAPGNITRIKAGSILRARRLV